MSLDSQQLVIFALGDEEYALPISSVQEIIRHTTPRQVPSDSPALVGVINLRSRIIPVFDLAARLGFSLGGAEESRHSDDSRRIVIVETTGGTTAGLLVDAVDEVLTVDRDSFDDVPSSPGGFIEHIAKVDERLILVLDSDRVIDVGAADTAVAA